MNKYIERNHCRQSSRLMLQQP